MKKFEQILADYEQAEIDILKKVKEVFLDVNDIAPKFNATISTTYSKLNGNSVIMYHEKLILADFYMNFKINIRKMFEHLYFLFFINRKNMKNIKLKFEKRTNANSFTE